MNLLVVLILFALKNADTSETSASKQKRQSPKCTPSISFKNCGNSSLVTYYLYYFVADVKVGCINHIIENTEWSMFSKEFQTRRTFPKFRNKLAFTINPGDFVDGEYILRLKVKESEGGESEAECAMTFIEHVPRLIYKWGLVRNVNGGQNVTIDLSDSVNFGRKPLVIVWTIVCAFRRIKQCSQETCLKVNNSMVFSFIASDCIINYKIGAMTIHNHLMHNYTQVVNVVLRKPLITSYITCLRNCKEKGRYFIDPKNALAVRLNCEPNCKLFQNATWTAATAFTGEKVYSLTEAIEIGNILILPANSITEYLNVFLKKIIPGSYNNIQISTQLGNFTDTCDIRPKEGISLETVFIVSCEVTVRYFQTRRPHFQVLMEGVVLAESAFSEFEIIVGSIKNKPIQELTVKAITAFHIDYFLTIPKIKVVESNLSNQTIRSYLTKIDKFIKDGNPDMGNKYIQALLTEMDKNEKITLDLKRAVFMKLINTVSNQNLENIQVYIQITNFLPHFYKTDIFTEDTKFALAKLCRRLSKMQLMLIGKSFFEEANEGDIKICANNTIMCANALLKFEAALSLTLETKLSEIPLVSEQAFIEDYPSYANAMSIEDQEFIVCVMQTIEFSLMAISRTLYIVDSYINKLEYFESQIIVDLAYRFAGKKIIVCNVSIEVASDIALEGSKSIVGIFVGYQKNVLDPNGDDTDTNIIDINFYAANDPIKVQFDITMEVNVSLTELSTASLVSEDEMNVHRVMVLKGRNLLIKFSEMDTDTKLKVVITKNRRPVIEDFDSAHIVNENSTNKILYDVNQPVDCIVYVAVLPHTDDLKISKNYTKYNIQILEKGCVLYRQTTNQWIPAPCKASLKYDGEKSTISCQCEHASFLGAIGRPVESKLDIIDVIPFQITHALKIVNYIICIFVAVVFAIYCIALCFAKLRNQTYRGRDKVLFLADNLKNDRFGYLIIVKTGAVAYSGTTSNIMFRIFAEFGQSKPHVLNYPDPYKMLLQRDDIECYILATEKYLGNIAYIHLWLDGLGLRPSWNCKHIVVVDLQTGAHFYFNVEQWLTVSKIDLFELKIKPSKALSTNYTAMDFISCINIYVGQHTWNIVNRTDDPKLSYPQRLTIILSAIYTTLFLTLLLIQLSEKEIFDKYYENPLRLLLVVIISSLLSSFIHCTYVFLFRNSEQECRKRMLIQYPKLLSFKWNRVAWVMLGVHIFCIMLYLILFGFWVSYKTSYICLIATIVSLLIIIFVLENLFLIILNEIVLKVTRKRHNKYLISDILEQAERQRKVLFKKFGELLLRPYFLKHYHVLEDPELRYARLKELARLEVANRFKNICLYVFYIVILFLILMIGNGTLIYATKKEMLLIVEGPPGEDYYFHSIATIEDVYDYLNITLINAIHISNWYGRYHYKDPGLLRDFNTKIIGVVQLRQQRREQKCSIPLKLEDLEITCDNSAPVFDDWKYDNGAVISDTAGELNIYGGEGFVTLLGRNLENSHYVMAILRKNRWIDINTKLLVAEFWTYNTNVNIFNAVRLIIERHSSGAYLTTTKITTTQFIHSVWTKIIIIGLIIIFTVIVMFLLIRQFIGIMKYHKNAFKNFWNLLEMAIVLLSITMIILFFVKMYKVSSILSRLSEEDRNEFVPYFGLIVISLSQRIVGSFLLCLSLIMLWKYLRFCLVFRMLKGTLQRCSLQLLSAAIYHTFVIIMFSMYITLLYYECEKFSTFGKTWMTLILWCLHGSRRSSRYSSECDNELYFIIFMFILISIVFFIIYVSIIMRAYLESANYYSNRRIKYSIRNYLTDEIFYHKELFKIRIRKDRLSAGRDSNRNDIDNINNRVGNISYVMVTPKAMAQRYADAFFLPEIRFNLMRLLSLGVIRNIGRPCTHSSNDSLTQKDYHLMQRIILNWLRKKPAVSKQELYMTGVDPISGEYRFINDSRFELMAFATRILLNSQNYIDSVDDKAANKVKVMRRLNDFKTQIGALKRMVHNIKIIE